MTKTAIVSSELKAVKCVLTPVALKYSATEFSACVYESDFNLDSGPCGNVFSRDRICYPSERAAKHQAVKRAERLAAIKRTECIDVIVKPVQVHKDN